MINNRRKTKCPDCGGEAYETMVADGFEDAPPSFTMTLDCEGGCRKKYYPNITPQKMNETWGLPVSGWSETRY